MKKFVLALAILLVSFASTSSAQDDKPLLLRQPTLSRTDIAFMYGDDLWKVSREGGDAIRLTAGPGIKRGPHFSPDGRVDRVYRRIRRQTECLRDFRKRRHAAPRHFSRRS